MKRIASLAVTGALGLALVTSGCGGGANQYMVRDTPEFDGVTKRLVGTWAARQVLVDEKDILGGTFEKSQVTFDFEAQKARYEFTVSQARLAEKLADWKGKWPDLQVDEYTVVVTAGWSMNKDGDAVKLADKVYELELRGGGENFQGFHDWERSRFDAAASAGNAAQTQSVNGGLGGLAAFALGKVADKAVKTATGTSDLFVAVSDLSTFEVGADGSLVLCGKGSGAAYRPDTASCEERLVTDRVR